MAEELKQDEPKLNKIGTDCNECIFSNVNEKKCFLGKLEKFIENGAEVQERDDKYLIDRICLFRRTDKWKKEKEHRESIEQAAQDVYKEVQICGTIVVYADEMNAVDECLQNLSKTKYIENFKVVIAHFDDVDVKQLYDYLQEQEHLEDVVAVRIYDDGEINFLDEAFKRAKNGFVITVDSQKKIDTSMLEKLQDYIYEKMKRVIYIPPSTGIHECVVFAVVYKYLKGNKFWTFEEKIQEFSKDQGLESQITSWKEINENFS